MQGMAKPKKPEPEPAKRRSNRTGLPLHVYLPPALRRAIDDMAESTQRTVTVEVMRALEAHLRAGGFWPPPEPKS